MSQKEATFLTITGLVLISVSIYGMWEYLPEALLGNRSWQGRDAMLWKILLISGVVALFIGTYSIYKKIKNKYT